MGFSRQEYWSGVPFPSPEDLPDPGIKPRSPALKADSLPTELQGKLRAYGAILMLKMHFSKARVAVLKRERPQVLGEVLLSTRQAALTATEFSWRSSRAPWLLWHLPPSCPVDTGLRGDRGLNPGPCDPGLPCSHLESRAEVGQG